MLRRHPLHRPTHAAVKRRWRRGRPVWGASRTGVVLAATPAQPHAGVANRIPLHLVDGHLGRMSVNELDETAALARWNLDVGDFAEALEERTQLILSDVARKTADEDSGVVWVGELVHRLGRAVVAHRRSTHTVHAHVWPATRHATHTTRRAATRLVLGSSRTDAHGTVTAVDALHLVQSGLLFLLVGEADEAVATRHAADGVGHDLGGLARIELVLEERQEDVLVDLGAEIADEDAILGSTVIAAAIGKATARGPVEFELAVGVRDHLAVKLERARCGIRAFEVDEAVAGIAAGELVADHLDIDLVAHAEPDAADEVLVDPRLKLAHPTLSSESRSPPHDFISTHQSVVFWSPPAAGPPGPPGAPP